MLGLGEHSPDPAAIARASLVQMNEMSRRAETGELVLGLGSGSGSGSGSSSGPASGSAATSGAGTPRSGPGPGVGPADGANTNAGTGTGIDMTAGDAPFMLPSDVSWDTLTHTGHEGLQVFTLGHLLPRSAVDDVNGNWTYIGDMASSASNGTGAGGAGGVDGVGDGENGAFEKEDSPGAEEVVQPTPTNLGVGESAAGSGGTTASSASDVGGRQKLRVRRSTFVPGWAVPPRVLLVDDDAVSRQLSSKFLQVFGCAIDVAVDGVGAVNKMNLEKYDLVLMVR